MEKIETLKSELMPEYQSDTSRLSVSAEKLQELGDSLSRRFQALRSGQERSQWEKDKAEAFAAYTLQPPNKVLPYDGYPNLRCVLTRIGVDSMHANTMYSVFGNGDTARVMPDYVSEMGIRTADKVSKILAYQLKYECDFYNKFDDADFKAHLYGRAFLEPYYCKEYAYVTERITEDEDEPVVDPTTGAVSFKKVKKSKTQKTKKVKFDGIKLEALPVDCIYYSPFFTSIKDAVKKDVAFKYTRHPLKTIKRQAKKQGDDESFYIASQVDELVGRKMSLLLDSTSALEQARKDFDGFTIEEILEQDQIDVVQAWLWEDVDGDGVDEEVSVVFEPTTKTVIRVALAKCRVVELKPRPIEGRADGESIFKAGMPIYEEWEAIHNARVAKGQWENLPFGFYEAGGRFNPQAIQITPGQFYPLDRGSKVDFAQPAPVGQSYYQEEQLLFSYWERMLGLSENMQGVGSSRDVSATENLQVSQRAAIRIATPISRITNAISELLGHMVDLNRDCAPSDKEFFITGPEGTAPLFGEAKREDYQPQMSFKVNVATTFDQQLMRDTWLMAFKMFRQDPLILSNPAAVYNLFKNTLKGMNIELDIPKPIQAKTLSVTEKIELLKQGEDVKPELGEDTESDLKFYMAYLETDKFKDATPEFKQAFVELIDKTKIQDQILKAAQLNQSGMYEPAIQNPKMPGMTASRNPSQMFNNMRAGESGPSQQNNAGQGQMNV